MYQALYSSTVSVLVLATFSCNVLIANKKVCTHEADTVCVEMSMVVGEFCACSDVFT